MGYKSRGAKHFVALLRGINVGGKNLLPMADLRAIFSNCGCHNVSTYIQSGNVIFSAPDSLVKNEITTQVSAEIKARYGLSVPLVVRTQASFEQVAAAHPFMDKASEPGLLHVLFLAKTPTLAEAQKLDPDRSPHDLYCLDKDHIYLFLANGVSGSKFTNAYFDAALDSMGTMRNWRTVGKLLGMLRDR